MSKQMHNIEELLLDYLDGNLDKNKLAFVERYLANNPQMAEDLAGLKEIILVPNADIIYKNKEQLKKTKVFRLPLYTKYAAAAGGAILIGLFLWMSIDKNPLKENYVAKLAPKIETIKQSNTIESNTANITTAIKSSEKLNSKTVVKQSYRETDIAIKQITPKKYKKRIIEPGEEEQQIAFENKETVNQTPVIIKEDILATLQTIQLTEINTNSFWSTPVIINQSKMILITEPKSLRSRFEALIPNELAKVEARVKSTIKEVGSDNMKEKIKSAFQFNKLKEALVPSTVQETITSIQ
ncbi:MAG TPA: hypothetical protein VK590_09070 [Saprospiraceae bacterium]|nr:hypothetical protein [Saprospiraceae bacterium]